MSILSDESLERLSRLRLVCELTPVLADSEHKCNWKQECVNMAAEVGWLLDTLGYPNAEAHLPKKKARKS